MTGLSDRVPDDRPAEAFAALGDETRLRILVELAEHASEAGFESGLSFADLRRRVGVEDAGRFNYHLDRLREGFVYKDGDEYRPRFPGLAVVSALYAGAYAGDDDERSADLDESCPVCERPLVARYAYETLVVECPEHGYAFSFPAPPGAAVDRSMADLVEVVCRRGQANVELARSGLCPRCWGSVSITYPVEAAPYETLAEDHPRALVECERCWLSYPLPLAAVLWSAPPVVAFYDEHGLDPARVGFGERSLIAASEVTILGRDPPRARVEVELDGDVLALVLDEDCRVVERERE